MSGEPYTSLLEETLEAWEDVRRGVLEEAEEIPGEEYGYRPHPEARSVSGLLVHILESGLMAAGELAREDGDFRRQGYPAFIEEYAGDLPDDPEPGELVELLRSTFGESASRLRAAGELHMLQLIHRFDGLRGTRLAWLHHAIAHEMYHRGQLAIYARAMGRQPALTRRIHGEEG